MKRISILSNKIRAEQRPPLVAHLVGPDLLTAWGFKKNKPALKPVSPNHLPMKTRRAGNPLYPELRVRGFQAAKEQSPLSQKPSENTPPVAKEPPALQNRPAEGNRSIQKETTPARDQAAASPPSPLNPPGKPDKQAERQDHPSSNPPGAPKEPPRQPFRQYGPEKPAGTDSPGAQHSYLNGKSGKVPGMNGSNGGPTRSSLFRPGVYTSMPAVRISPKTDIPTQAPFGIPTPPAEASAPNQENSKTVPEVITQKAAKSSNLEQLLKDNAGLPDQAVILGVCEDGLPVLIDMNDPNPGALVAIGDEREEQLDFLRMAMVSLARRNSPRTVQFLIFSHDPHAWESWAQAQGYTRHCLAIESVEEEKVRDWIVRLADWTEQRRLGQRSGPAVLLVMDTLSFLPQLTYDIRLNFEWMAKEGPQAKIWPIAVISTELAKSLNSRRLLRSFQTRVMGFVKNPADYTLLAGVDELSAESFGRKGEFRVKVGEDWLQFRLLSKVY